MKIALSKIITADNFTSLDKLNCEVDRLHQLTNRWLGREILKISRFVMREAQMLTVNKTLPSSFDQKMIFSVFIPEIAFRLGETQFHPHERRSSVHKYDIGMMRKMLSSLLYSDMAFMNHFSQKPIRGANPYLMMTRSPELGNPLVIAMDRITPKHVFDNDILASRIYNFCLEKGVEPQLTWTPALRAKINGTAEKWILPVELEPVGAIETVPAIRL